MIPTDRFDDYRREETPRCPNPFCRSAVGVPGEFCKICTDQQKRHIAGMKAHLEKRQSA